VILYYSTNVNLPFANLRGPSQGSLYGRYPNDLFRYFTTQNVSSWLFGYPDPVVDNLNALYPQYVSRYQGVLGPNENILNPAQRPDVMYVVRNDPPTPLASPCLPHTLRLAWSEQPSV
jgi:hypothetical protein